jgi:hypothetical protein
LRVTFEAIRLVLAHKLIKDVLSHMAKRRMAKVVRQGSGLDHFWMHTQKLAEVRLFRNAFLR